MIFNREGTRRDFFGIFIPHQSKSKIKSKRKMMPVLRVRCGGSLRSAIAEDHAAFHVTPPHLHLALVVVVVVERKLDPRSSVIALATHPPRESE